jgi:hypothetical protein
MEEALKIRAAILKQTRKAHTAQKPSDQFSEDTRRFILAAVGGPLTSEAIAKKAQISTKSIPPLIRGLTIWARRHGFDLNEAIERIQKYVKGKPISTYRLTEKGAEIFESFLDESSDGSKSSESHKTAKS